MSFILSVTPNDKTRFMVALPLAFIVTVFLVFIMHRLVFQESVGIPSDSPVIIPPIIMPPDIDPTVRYTEIVKPEEAAFEPPVPEVQLFVDPGAEFFIPSDPVDVVIDTNMNFSVGGDSPLAQVLISPNYPTNAVRREIEGYVDVQFDVTVTGATTNVVVIKADPRGVFEQAAMKAVKKWKYQPMRDKNDKPIPFSGLIHRVSFEMEKRA
ncbi:MAG: protein TonB [Flavobacteriales bacterium]|jgi:protein TonB